jgi:hypothetical protein
VRAGTERLRPGHVAPPAHKARLNAGASVIGLGTLYFRAAEFPEREMISSVRYGLALSLMWVALTTAGGATAQGVYVPMPGSAPAQTGPNLINPSAPASSVNPNALNPSAAPSAVTSPNALNPSATPSTFAPILSEPGGERRVLIGPVDPLYGIVPGSGRRRAARIRRRSPRPSIHRRATSAVREAPSRIDRRARAIEGSICRGC